MYTGYMYIHRVCTCTQGMYTGYVHWVHVCKCTQGICTQGMYTRHVHRVCAQGMYTGYVHGRISLDSKKLPYIDRSLTDLRY